MIFDNNKHTLNIIVYIFKLKIMDTSFSLERIGSIVKI